MRQRRGDIGECRRTVEVIGGDSVRERNFATRTRLDESRPPLDAGAVNGDDTNFCDVIVGRAEARRFDIYECERLVS